MIESLVSVFQRDLEKLKDEIKSFQREDDIWITPSGVKNSAGNLCLHICGNLKHFIGAVLGNTKYIREREKEFSLKNVPRSELISNIDETFKTVTSVLKGMDENLLTKKYPLNVFDEEMTTEFFLIHLTAHLNYHLGQTNYLRRIIIE